MAVPWTKRARRRVRSAIILAALRVLGLLPLGAALAFGRAGGALAWRLAGRTRRLALAHLARAFPALPPAEREALGRGMMRHLGMAAMELVAVRAVDPVLEAYVAMPGEPLLREVLGRGKGCVFVTGHLGNWELMARRVGRTGLKPVAVAKRGGDARLMDEIGRWRASGDVRTLWREDADSVRTIIRTLRDGHILGLLIDQDTKVQGVFVPFFGALAWTPRAAADFALRFRAPVVVGTCHRRGPAPGAGHEVELTEVAHDPDAPDREAESVRLTAACTAIMEAAIRRHPAEWVWMHERWKTRPEGEAPPAPPPGG